MHNSLYIRDLLRSANSDPMRRERRNPHRHIALDRSRRPREGELLLDGPWCVSSDLAADIARLLIQDSSEFLRIMGAETVGKADGECDHARASRLDLRLADDLGKRDCRLTCRPGEVVIEGGGVAGVWAGLTWLEWEMRTRRAPILPCGQFTLRAAWGSQISQGPWGGNYSVPDFSPEYLSDDSFRLYAHYGVNEMMIYGDLLCYVRSEIFPEFTCEGYQQNLAMLKEAAARAERYGVRFSYLVVGPKFRSDHPLFVRLPQVRGSGREAPDGSLVHNLCSSQPLVQEFYRETFWNLFHEVPQLAGVNLIVANESMYHCRMSWPWVKSKCPVCASKTTEQVVSELAETIRSAVASASSEAYTSVWAYSTDPGWSRPDRLELVRTLPAGVAIYHALEKDQAYRKDGYVKNVWDYSIDFTGPSEGMLRVAEAAREVARPLVVKTETGIGLEVFQFPYVPAMQRLAAKWQAVRDLRPAGVQQSWLFFGMFGSRAEELGLWAAYRPDMNLEEFLRRIAVRDFGPQAAGEALASWAEMSQAVKHIPCVTLQHYYVGPSFLGPAHPLVPARDAVVPEVFHGYLFYLQEGEETFSRRQIAEARTCLVMASLPEDARAVGIEWEGESDGWDIIVREYAAATEHAYAAWKRLQAAGAAAQAEADKAHLHEEMLLTELVYRTLRSCHSTVCFLLARRRWERTGDVDAREEMIRIAEGERDNALEAVPIYQQAPWLDLSERTDGKFHSCLDMIAAKIQWIDSLWK